MSAICGVVHRGGADLPPDAVQPMMSRLAAYGADGSDRWKRNSVALGHHHLRVTPESRYADMPLVDDGVALVADARLDNRDRLMPALDVPVAEARRTPDSALLLKAWHRWGESCVDHLVGDFAFALWDERRDLLFCARDHLGIRPLYYHAGTDILAFSTGERALLELPGVPWDLDEPAIADHLCANWGRDRAATFFAAIRRLPPAHVLTVRRGEVRTHRYWTPDLSREVRFARDEDYVAAYREHLERAVRDRVRAMAPVASFLSGGLDSSAVACLAARELAGAGGPPLLTFSNVLSSEEDWPRGDERELVEAVLASQPHMEGRFVTTGGKSLVGSVLESRDSGPGLPGQGTQFVTEAVREARRRGVRVLLDGYGGDQVATSRAGYALDELLGTGRWPTFWKLARSRAAETPRPAWRVAGAAARRILEARSPDWVSRLWGTHRTARVKEARARARHFVAPDLASRVRLDERVAEGPRFATASFRRLREHQWHLLSAWQPERVVERIHPVLAGHHVQRTLPLLDRRLVEYCLAVPCEQHGRGMGRSLIRRAMEGVLPDEVRLRDDKTFAAIPAPPRYVGGERRLLREILDTLDREPLVGAFVDVARLRSCLASDLPGELQRAGRPPVDLNAAQRALRTAFLLAWVAEERKARFCF